MNNKSKTKITTSFEKNAYLEFSRLARIEGRTISKMIEILVKDYKKKHCRNQTAKQNFSKMEELS